MDVLVFTHQHLVTPDEGGITQLCRTVVEEEGHHCDEVAIYLISKEASGRLHAQYFDDPSPTDCMSFPMDEPGTPVQEGAPSALGEVFVCPEIAQEAVAAGLGASLEEEIALYIIHGLLHLLGYDDRTDEDRAQMREKESTYLEKWRAVGVSVAHLQSATPPLS